MKEEKYRQLLPIARSLMLGEEDLIARMANLATLLHHEFGFWWTGFTAPRTAANSSSAPYKNLLPVRE